MNFKQATPIQEQAIPAILEGKDLIACAQTGTGKTAAYLLPLLDRIARSKHDHTSVLILVPTRELAKQIDEQVEGLSYFVSATSIAIYGGGKGSDWDQQKKGLSNGADIVIATPGRLIAQMQLGYNQFDNLDCLVLDEADKMLDMGFADDIMNIIRKLPVKRQTLLFSATMPNKIREFSKRILMDPQEIRLAVSKPAEGIDQQFYLAHDRQKLPILEHILQQTNVQSMVMFTSRKSEVNVLVRSLKKLGYDAKGISSDLEQDEREIVLREFKMKQFPILVATDVLSRGIDIDNLSHVVNYDIPRDAEDYIHRIGRTARAATTGTAITFVSGDELYRVAKIEKLLEREVEKRIITEELGLGPAPDPTVKRSGQHERGHKGGSGSSSGTNNNDRRRNGKRRSGSSRGQSGERSPQAQQAAPAPVEASAAPVAVTGEGGEAKKKSRSRRRRPRPKSSGAEVTA
ncbi:DEAD/DEAH box helicase [Tellurirhabdus rosea]|uniref:DEAD/DEAH box helicase n=1 Tax=Tellurirhabdus rosea TaxID=2674997 RepID=UPI00225B034E|nr:DEAD/DEAH box helicase [Tellurirhabdus rosea]